MGGEDVGWQDGGEDEGVSEGMKEECMDVCGVCVRDS